MAVGTEKHTSGTREALWVLVGLNLAVFLTLAIMTSIGADDAQFSLGRSIEALAERPWTLISYMFAQTDTLHLLFNIAALWIFGSAWLRNHSGLSLIALYVTGGIAGAVAFLVTPSDISGEDLTGASASVLAVITAVTCSSPRLKVKWPLSGGHFMLLYVAIAVYIIIAFEISGTNIGATAAHLGGIVAGGAYALAARRAKATTPQTEASETRERLLRKIKASGYSSLTAGERNILQSQKSVK